MIGRTNSSSMSSTTTALDFTVVDGLTEPVNPKEKMIWIATDEEITSWTFSATEPEAQQGLVWFQIGQSSSVAFSITKDNPIMVYPIKAQQYINNTWVEKTTKIYLNGEWLIWYSTTYWFKQGEGPTDSWRGMSEGNGSWYIQQNKLQLTSEGAGKTKIAIASKSKINLTNFNILHFKAEAENNNSRVIFGIANDIQYDESTDSVNFNYVSSVNQESVENKEWQINVSKITGEYYIVISNSFANGASGSAYIYDIWGT